MYNFNVILYTTVRFGFNLSKVWQTYHVKGQGFSLCALTLHKQRKSIALQNTEQFHIERTWDNWLDILNSLSNVSIKVYLLIKLKRNFLNSNWKYFQRNCKQRYWDDFLPEEFLRWQISILIGNLKAGRWGWSKRLNEWKCFADIFKCKRWM